MMYLTQFEAYLLTHKRVSPHTLSAYRSDLRQLQEFLDDEKIALEKVTEDVLKKYLYFLKHERHLDARSVARKIASIKAFFNYMHAHHAIANPTHDLYTPKVKKALPIFLTPEEITELFTVAQRDTSLLGKRNYMMLSLLYASGMRISELVQLCLADIQCDTGFVTVRGKGSKERMVPLPEPVLNDIAAYIREIRPQLLTDTSNATHEWLFPTKYGGKIKHMTRQAFWIIVQALWKQTGIKKHLSPHKLRHSLATHLLKNGVDLRSLQLLLGHERISTVEIYTHVETSRLREEYDKKHPRS